MAESGFIALHRKIRESYVYDLPPAQRCVAIEIFLSANWAPRRWHADGEVVPINRGELVTSVRRLALAVGVSKSAVERALAALVRGGTIKVEARHRRTHITVLNYARYNDLADLPRDTNGDSLEDSLEDSNESQKNQVTKKPRNQGDTDARRKGSQGELPLAAPDTPEAITRSRGNANGARKRATPKPPPLPFTVGQLLETIGPASGGKVITETFVAEPRRWAPPLTRVVRELAAMGATLADVRRAGERIATWRRPRSLAWLAKTGNLAEVIRDAGPSAATQGDRL